MFRYLALRSTFYSLLCIAAFAVLQFRYVVPYLRLDGQSTLRGALLGEYPLRIGWPQEFYYYHPSPSYQLDLKMLFWDVVIALPVVASVAFGLRMLLAREKLASVDVFLLTTATAFFTAIPQMTLGYFDDNLLLPTILNYAEFVVAIAFSVGCYAILETVSNVISTSEIDDARFNER
ncbi:MAG: hypothetical protein KDB03_25960 [Planctomycetales bacterium]|nr:hypothetical protein [Planctomycetales bacterium]